MIWWELLNKDCDVITTKKDVLSISDGNVVEKKFTDEIIIRNRNYKSK